MKRLITFIFILLWSNLALAQMPGMPKLTDQQKKDFANAAKEMGAISKDEIDASISNLVKQGVITPEHAAEAREKLKALTPEQVEQLKKASIQMMSN